MFAGDDRMRVAHGWAALQFGDRTAQMLGRLTLNPIKTYRSSRDDCRAWLVGSMTTGFIFGWAKPVPVNDPQYAKRQKPDMAWVALAGPMANLVMAVIVVD